MWIARRMLRIPWIERVTNREVLKRSKHLTRIRQHYQVPENLYLGHIFRSIKYRLLQLTLKEKIEGRREPGRKQLSWLRNIEGMGRHAKRGVTVSRGGNQECLHQSDCQWPISGRPAKHLRKKTTKLFNLEIYQLYFFCKVYKKPAFDKLHYNDFSAVYLKL